MNNTQKGNIKKTDKYGNGDYNILPPLYFRANLTMKILFDEIAKRAGIRKSQLIERTIVNGLEREAADCGITTDELTEIKVIASQKADAIRELEFSKRSIAV